MIFDPFGDFESRGYLRNTAALHDPVAVKEFEHRAFLAKLDQAFSNLAPIERLSYRDVLNTHKTLFEAVYSWAGQDRMLTAPDIAVSKGDVLFAHPRDAKAAVEHALKIGHDPTLMAKMPGEIMGYLAYGHPFLDGNGRTIMVVHAELAQRAGISIDWAATSKADYLTALTQELERPGKGHLDVYLKPYIRAAVGHDLLAQHVVQTQGLGGNPHEPLDANQVLGKFNDPVLEARYRHQQERRQRQEGAPLEPGPENDRRTDRGGRGR
jgi:cell filamentation protein